MNEWKERMSLVLSHRILKGFTDFERASTTRVNRPIIPLATCSERAYSVMDYQDLPITNEEAL